MIFRYAIHRKGLDPFQAAKAWRLRVQQGLPWKAVRALVRTVSVVATLGLSAANLAMLSKDHWMKNSLNTVQLHLRESVKRSE